MRFSKSWRKVLVYQAIGFALLIGFVWFEDVRGLPQFLFGGGNHVHDWRDSAMATLVILYVAAIILGLTLRLLERLRHLEDMLKICAWCRKIGHHNQWLKMEDYFERGFQIYTTHGMCPDCLKKVQEDAQRVKAAELAAARNDPAPEQGQC